MNEFVTSCYQAYRQLGSLELLSMLSEGCYIIQDAVNTLADTQTEIAEIERIQHALVTMCAAISALAPESADRLSYDTGCQKTIEHWKMISEVSI